MKFNKTVKILEEYRKRFSLKKRWMAQLLGISDGHYSDLIAGRRNAGAKLQERALKQVLRCPTCEKEIKNDRIYDSKQSSGNGACEGIHEEGR